MAQWTAAEQTGQARQNDGAEHDATSEFVAVPSRLEIGAKSHFEFIVDRVRASFRRFASRNISACICHGILITVTGPTVMFTDQRQHTAQTPVPEPGRSVFSQDTCLPLQRSMCQERDTNRRHAR
jgi:hypothetical protein